MILLKTPQEIEVMKKAGRITAKILHEIAGAVQSGVSTRELDYLAEARTVEMGGIPAFKGYQGYPCSICISVNDEVVHGIPSTKRILKTGDIVGLDFGVIVDGFYGDAAMTVPVGTVSIQAKNLINATQECLYKGIAEARVGNRLFDISNAIQKYVEGLRFSVVRDFVGHGIGRHLHEEPQVPNFGPKGKGIPLREGMVLAIEPMVTIGNHAIKIQADGWTAVTVDGSLSAHFEHTVAITKDGPQILTENN